MPLKAIIFDVNGTLADTEDTHRIVVRQVELRAAIDAIVADLEGEQA